MLEATLVPSLIVPIEATGEATLPPTTLVITPIPSRTISGSDRAIAHSGRITIVSSAERVPENSMVSLVFDGEELANVSSVAIACQTDPAGCSVQAQPGTWFSREPGMATDSGYQTDGRWRLSAARPSSVGEFSDTGDLLDADC